MLAGHAARPGDGHRLSLLRATELPVLTGIDADWRAARPDKPDTPTEQKPAVKDESRVRILPQLHAGRCGRSAREGRCRRRPDRQQRQPGHEDEPDHNDREKIAERSHQVDTADRAARAELAEGKNPAEVRDVEAVLEAFAAERLLTLASDTVEISHEVLLTAWPLLRDTWLAETYADRVVRTRLHNVTAEWIRHSRDPSYLYGGSLLEAAAETAARIGADPRRNLPLSQAERDFLHASGRAHRRTARRRHAVIAGLLALTLTAIAAAGIAVHNAANASRQAANASRQAAYASRQHTIALSRQLAAEGLAIESSDPVTARRLAVAAWHAFRTDQAGSCSLRCLPSNNKEASSPPVPAA